MHYKIMKVFEVQQMPQAVRWAFEEIHIDAGNGDYNRHPIGESARAWESAKVRESYQTLDSWLLDNGADPAEAVLLHNWR